MSIPSSPIYWVNIGDGFALLSISSHVTVSVAFGQGGIVYEHAPATNHGAGPPPDVQQDRDGRRNSGASVVLRTVLDHGPVPRSTIALLTRLSPATVSRHCASLAGQGLLRDVAQAPTGVGRPHVPVDIDSRRYLVGGLHIAVHHATLALMDLRGRIVATQRIPHDGGDAGSVLEGIVAHVPDFLVTHAGGRTPLGLGIATGGWVDSTSGVVVRNSLLGWRDVPVRDVVATSVRLPVYIDGHARALARAELLFGDVRASARVSIVHLFIGNVVDAAFATAGSVHYGPRSAAGEIAHLAMDGGREPCGCGRVGCLQAEVSDQAVADRAARDGIIAEPSLPALLSKARAGEARALELMRERARMIGRAAALLLDVLNPEVLVVTEMGVAHLPQCLADLRATVRAHARLCGDEQRRIVPTSFAGSVLATAGAAVMLDSLYADPAAHLPTLSRAS
jgi:predicted NBD/HSP70 family sugar kinase